LGSSFGVIIVCLEVGSDSMRKRIFFFFFLFSLGFFSFQFFGRERYLLLLARVVVGVFSFQGIEEGGILKGKGGERGGLRFHIIDQFSDSNES